jgi:hypothetical protein
LPRNQQPDTSFVVAPIRDHAFFEQTVLERQVGHAFLQGAGFAAQILHLAAGRGTLKTYTTRRDTTLGDPALHVAPAQPR